MPFAFGRFVKFLSISIAFLVIAVIFISCGDSLTQSSSDSNDSQPAVDTIPPAPVSDLAVISVQQTECTLRWSTTPDAAKYSLRYRTDTLTESLWDSATVVSDDIFPGGDSITITVRGLTPEVFYCFGVRSCDTAGNWSALSNVVCFSTLAVPDTGDSSSPDSSDTTSPPQDTIPPAPITDLSVAEGYYETPQITFTVPNDAISECIVRVSSDNDFSHYDSMVIYSPTPGGTQTVNLSTMVYIPGERQFISVVSIDTAGNISDNSNIVGFKQVYIIMADRCIACGRCYSACDYGAISYNGSVYIINPDNCHCCGECVSRCPRNAIHKYVKVYSGVLK